MMSRVPMNNPIDYDPHEPCRRHIMELERQLHHLEHPPIQIIIEEGDQNGIWDRVAMVKRIVRDKAGIIVFCV